jgi:hypothetical protein
LAVEYSSSIAKTNDVNKQKFFFSSKANTKKSQVMPNLFLANREARLAAPSGSENKPENQWAALRAAHELVSEKPKSVV